MPPDASLLDPALLAATRDLALVARSVVDGFLVGRHTSRIPGEGMEFSRYRSYEPGDDLRRVDWKLYARSDRYFVREADVETSVTVHLVLDASRSMAYAEDGREKLAYARVVTAALAYLAGRQGDAVGLHVVRGGRVETLPARRGAQHLHRLLHHLEGVAPGGRWPGLGALRGLVGAPERALVVVLTDLHEHDEEILGGLSRLGGRHETLLLHLVGPRELTLDYGGPVLLEDLETGQTVEVDPAAARPAYEAALAAHLRRVQRRLTERGVGYARLRLDEAPAIALRAFLQRRLRGG